MKPKLKENTRLKSSTIVTKFWKEWKTIPTNISRRLKDSHEEFTVTYLKLYYKNKSSQVLLKIKLKTE